MGGVARHPDQATGLRPWPVDPPRKGLGSVGREGYLGRRAVPACLGMEVGAEIKVEQRTDNTEIWRFFFHHATGSHHYYKHRNRPGQVHPCRLLQARDDPGAIGCHDMVICTYIPGGPIMATKRLTIELPFDQYEFLRKEAIRLGTTVSGLIRTLIEESRTEPSEAIKAAYPQDPFFQRRGSFEGPPDLAEYHDRYLYQASS